MGPQPADGVLGDVGGKVRAGGAEQKHADHLVALPYPEGHRLGANGAGALVLSELGAYELNEKLILPKSSDIKRQFTIAIGMAKPVT